MEENLNEKVVDDEEMANVEEHVNEAVSLGIHFFLSNLLIKLNVLVLSY